MFRDRVIDAWRNASLLDFVIHSRMSYYDLIIPELTCFSGRKAIRPEMRRIEYECFYDRIVRTGLQVLKSAGAAVPMIQEQDLQSLVALFPPFPPIGQTKKWRKELIEASSWMPEPRAPQEILGLVHAEPIKMLREAKPKLLQLQMELFEYLKLLQVAPTEAFAQLESVAPSPDSNSFPFEIIPVSTPYFDSAEISSRAVDPSTIPPKTPETPPRTPRQADETPGLPLDELTGTMKDLLTGAFNLRAFDRASCCSQDEIVKAAGLTSVESRNVRNAFKRCKDEGLIKTKRGTNGGTWITAKGCEFIGKSFPSAPLTHLTE
jgi:hypothetical protein